MPAELPRAGEPGAAGAPHVLVLDVGSSSVRAGLYDQTGVSLEYGSDAQLAYRWRTTAEGGMEIDAPALFELLVRVIDIALDEARRRDWTIAGVAMATFWHSILGVGPDGEPLTPVFSWGDTRAAARALALRERLEEQQVHQRTGCFLHPSYPTAKLLWLRETRPETFRRVARWMSVGEFFGQWLFGEPRCSVSMASGTGLLDVHRIRWDEEMLDATGVTPDSLSPIVDLDEPFRGLLPEFAARWPELDRVPWYPAVGDGACANVGSGAVGGDRAGLTVGTSAALRLLWEGEATRVPEDLWCYRLDRRRFVAGGALSNGGNAVEFLHGTMRLPPESEWDAALGALPPDSHGLTVLPYLVGERGPGWLRHGRAALLGLTQNTHPLDIMRAWFEAVAFRLARIEAELAEAYGAPRQIFASGGALHASSVWTQIIADAIGRPLRLTAEPEATSRGVALVALEQLGLIEDLTAAPLLDAVEFRPDPAHHARYQAAMERQHAVEQALLPWLAPPPPDVDAVADPLPT